MEKLKVAVIGSGVMGKTHLRCYKELSKKAEVVAVCDGDIDKAKEAAEICGSNYYASAEEMFKKEEIDLLDICLPTFLHTHYAVLGMEKGIKNVLIEKPVCSNLSEARLLLDTQKRTGANVQVAQVVRFASKYFYVRDAIKSGKYGKIISGTFSRFSPYPTWSPYLMDWRKSGTVAVDLHIHDVDYIRFLMGREPDEVVSTAARDKEGVITHIFSNYRFDNAVISAEATWMCSESYPFAPFFQVNAEKATFVYRNDKLTVYPEGADPFHPDLQVVWEKKVDDLGNLSNLEIYYLEMRYFVDSFLGKQEVLVSLEDAVKTLELVYKEIEIAGGMQKLDL